MKFRLALLTYGHPHSLRILQGLKQAGVGVEAVILETRPCLRDNLPGSLQEWSFLKRYLVAARHWIGNWYRLLPAHSRYASVAEKLIFSGPLNSDRMVADLHKLAPDFLLLGGIGIIANPVIEAARLGVLNTHPGLLPWIRGTGVIGRALERQIPVGATAHYVNSGIDRGDIIERRLLPVTEKENSLSELESASDDLIAQMMVDLVVEYLLPGRLPEVVRQDTHYPLCKSMKPVERKAIDEQIRGGLARQLFETWKSYCLDQEKYRLPSDFKGPDGPTTTH